MYSGAQATLDVEFLSSYVQAHPDLLDIDPLDEQQKLVDISQFDDKTLANAVVRTRLKRLAMRGHNAKEAASIVGWSPASVRTIYNDPDFRREVIGSLEGVFDDIDTVFKESQKSLNERLEESASMAFDEMMKLFPEMSANQKIKVTQDLLDRNDATNKRHTHISKDAPNFTSEQLANAARAAQEMDAVRAGKLARFKKAV